MRHLSAVPMLSTAMITILMLSMSILIACAVTGSGPRPPEPISQPETPQDDTAPRAPEIQADSPWESDAPPDLAGETPGSASVEESPPPTGARTMPVELANLATPAPRSEEMKSDMHSATAEDFVGIPPGPAPAARPQQKTTSEPSSGGHPTSGPRPRESTAARARPRSPNGTSRPAR